MKKVYALLLEGSERGYDRTTPVLFESQRDAAAYIAAFFERPTSLRGAYRVELRRLEYRTGTDKEEEES